MAHKDRDAEEFRLWLRRETIDQVKLLALILRRPDWHIVLDDVIQLGVFYLNKAAKLELADWKDYRKLIDNAEDLNLRIIKGGLPELEEIDADD